MIADRSADRQALIQALDGLIVPCQSPVHHTHVAEEAALSIRVAAVLGDLQCLFEAIYGNEQAPGRRLTVPMKVVKSVNHRSVKRPAREFLEPIHANLSDPHKVQRPSLPPTVTHLSP